MAEVALAGSLFSTLGSAIPPFLQKLSELGVTTHRGATVFYKSCEIEFVFHFNIGKIESRLETIIKPLQKLLAKPLEFEHAIEIIGYTLTGNQDLKQLGIIKLQNDKAIVDFKKLLELKSDVIVLQVRQKLSQEVPKHLLSIHIDKNPEHIGSLVSSDIEVALDYGNLWYKDFTHFNVRDIEFSFNLGVGLETIIQELPEQQRRKLINAGKAYSKGNKDAITYVRIFSDNFLKFQGDELQKDLTDCVYLEPKNNFNLKSIQPKMQTAEIASVGHPVVLPGSMKIFLECRLEGNDIALKGKISIDLEKFSKVLRKIVSSIERESSGLNLS